MNDQGAMSCVRRYDDLSQAKPIFVERFIAAYACPLGEGFPSRRSPMLHWLAQKLRKWQTLVITATLSVGRFDTSEASEINMKELFLIAGLQSRLLR